MRPVTAVLRQVAEGGGTSGEAMIAETKATALAVQLQVEVDGPPASASAAAAVTGSGATAAGVAQRHKRRASVPHLAAPPTSLPAAAAAGDERPSRPAPLSLPSPAAASLAPDELAYERASSTRSEMVTGSGEGAPPTWPRVRAAVTLAGPQASLIAQLLIAHRNGDAVHNTAP